jgi:xanthine/uracil/vitamin C permease (AzgA family)
MPLAYSITDGIGMGIITFVILDLVIYLTDLLSYNLGITKEKPKTEITLVTVIVFILFLIYFLVPTVL